MAALDEDGSWEGRLGGAVRLGMIYEKADGLVGNPATVAGRQPITGFAQDKAVLRPRPEIGNHSADRVRGRLREVVGFVTRPPPFRRTSARDLVRIPPFTPRSGDRIEGRAPQPHALCVNIGLPYRRVRDCDVIIKYGDASPNLGAMCRVDAGQVNGVAARSDPRRPSDSGSRRAVAPGCSAGRRTI